MPPHNRQTVAPARRIGRLLRGIGALLVLIAVVVGVPVLMLRFNLVPHSIPSLHRIISVLRQRDNGQLVAGVLAAGVWVCWALFTASLIPEIAALARKRPTRPLPGLGVFHGPAGALVAAIAIGFTIVPLFAGVATAARVTAASPPLVAVSSSMMSVVPLHVAESPVAAATTHSDTARPLTASPSANAPTYEVQRRDTLWRIAERFLHDPLRYPEIAQLNPTLVGPDNEIRAGVLLTLPVDATGPGLTQPSVAASDVHEVTVLVEPGDDLYSIEQRVTGDGSNWQQGFAANQGRVEPRGERFTNPGLIKPGWTLDIPVAAPAPVTATPSTDPAPPRTTTPTHDTVPGTTATSPHTTLPSSNPAPTPPTQPAPTQRVAEDPPSEAARPAGSAPVRDADTRSIAGSSQSSETSVVAFAGGGLLLAGLSLGALVTYRRRQFQRRHPGRIIGGSPAELIPMERAVLSAGTIGMADVTWLDEALRSLVQSIMDVPDARLPDVIALRMTDTELSFLLTQAAPVAPTPWRVSDDATRWTIHRSDPLPYDASRRESYCAPFPTLTTVGYTEAGEHWMLDLERIGALSLSGDPERCLNLARFLAAELTHNTWSEMLHVTLVGFGQELVAANPDRLTYTKNLVTATTAVERRLASVNTAMVAVSTDALDGRLHEIAGDQWAPMVLLIAPDLAADAAGLDALLAALRHQPTRACVAVVLVNDPDRTDAARWRLTIDHQGTLTIPALGVELIAQQLPADEAAPLAQMLAWAATCEDEPIPPAHGDQPWDEYADACGGLIVPAETAPPQTTSIETVTAERMSTEQGLTAALSADVIEAPAVTATRPIPSAAAAAPLLHLAESAPRMTSSILPLPPRTYLDRAATTVKDLAALAPTVDGRIRNCVEQADPDLDQDYADWVDQTCPRPKVRLLGRPEVWAQGRLPERTPQVAFHTEAVVLLATRTRGLPSSEYAELMWPADPDVVGKAKVRKSIGNLRGWLGQDTASGGEYLVSSFENRIAQYRLRRALCDAELFRRLRVRGVARGADGLADLWKALDLVDGPPFDAVTIRGERDGDTRPGGWAWLTDANQRLDFEYQAMIVDTAHTVADRHLGASEPALAEKAAKIALRAGAYDDVPLLDLIAACLAQNHDAEAEAYVQQLLSNAGVEREEDLQPRTAEVLFRLRRRWRTQAS